jgi:hypothetical protein
LRFSMLARARPEVAEELMGLAQRDIDDRWHLYEQMVEVERTARYGVLDPESDEDHETDEKGTT